ncbi:amphi-Trp domain-containing protein [Maridesulfovibrio sp.]|uniref:amphi-Trp domain-containing protein n=1 Tax=unclassified Maridesulfovibrio TaxID=2794999 RepID=UPI003B00A420
MGKEVVLFKSEEKKTAAEAAEVLRLVADRVESGKLILSAGGEPVELEIPGQVTLEIKAEEETGSSGKVKRSLELEVEWAVGDDVGSGGGVSIG